MRPATAFLVLVGIQALHSIEETTFGLYHLLPYFTPFGDGAFAAFATGNTMIVFFGLWCYRYRVQPRADTANGWIWGWSLVELANGIGHLTWTLLAGQYIPGTATAPFLLAASCYLIWRLTRARAHAIQVKVIRKS